VINAHKWFTSGAASPLCSFAILMGVSDPEADRHRRHSMVLVPFDTPGVTVERTLPVFGHDAGGGHGETLFQDVRIPKEYLLGEEGGGFAIAQARLGPGRVHHCMRAIGMAEKALRLMCERTQQRVAFGKPLADQGTTQAQIAESRIEIEQARLLTMKAAWLMDTVGAKGARFEIGAIKVVAARLATTVIDRAIQAFGAAGVTDDWPLASMYTRARTLHLVDGPDEVHLQQIARRELRGYESFRTVP
jgi:acyl-CoA dehydrogenase